MTPALLLVLLLNLPPAPPCECSTDSECAELCGGNGDPTPAWCPDPADPYAADAFDPEVLNACGHEAQP